MNTQISNSDARVESLLPEELEKYIFEMTATRYPSTATVLAVVARRVQAWMEAMIYESIILYDATVCRCLLYTIGQRPPSFFTDTVKSLCIPGDIVPANAKQILAVCQGVVNLAYWIRNPSFPAPFIFISHNLRPKRLSFNTHGLFNLMTPPDFTLPFFSLVTHLEIVDWPFIAESCRFEWLPSLTHLAVDIDQYGNSVVLALRRILLSCERLRVLLCLVQQDGGIANVQMALQSVVDGDPRLVILLDSQPLRSWEASLDAWSEGCQWRCAEGIVEERRARG